MSMSHVHFNRAALMTSLCGVLLTLAACGGGDSGTTSSAPGTAAPVLADDDSALAAYDLLNDERARCGFGRLARSSQLDLSARMHGLYLQANPTITREEDPSKPAFYAASPADRAMKAGYVTGAVEVVAAGPDALAATRHLLAGPFDGFVMLTSSFLEVGVASTPMGTGRSSLVMDFGRPQGQQPPLVSSVRTYPCEGSVGVAAVRGGETPNPFPNEANPQWGQPIFVFDDDLLFQLTSASITGPSGPVAIQLIYAAGQANDPLGYFQLGAAAIIPAPLAPSTLYTVTINGRTGSGPFTQTFRFQTGSAA